MLTRETMEGIYVLPPTPFDEDGVFDEDALRENVRRLAEAGISAYVTTGSVGEFHTISPQDHQRLAKALAESCQQAGIVSVCGCSGVNTDEAIMKVTWARNPGCDAVMNVSPYYIQLTRAELVKYWRDLAEACPRIGLIVYNNPQTSQLHDEETYAEIVKIPTLCGSKEAHYDFSLWYRLHRAFPQLGLFTATEPEWILPTLKLGARGIFSMAASMIPHFIVELYQACRKGQWDKAVKMQMEWEAMQRRVGGHEALEGYNGVARFKAVVNAFGYLRCGYSRRPLISVPKQNQERLAEFVHKNFAGLIRG